MLYSEIIAVCSEIHTKPINTLCGQNVEFVKVKLTVHIVTTGIAFIITVLICIYQNQHNLRHYHQCVFRPVISSGVEIQSNPLITTSV
jgi:hypothetical protein